MKNCPLKTHRDFCLLLVLFVINHVQIESTNLGGEITVNTTLGRNDSAYIVSQDLVVTENATLTIEPGVQLHFKAGVALQVKGSLQAKGNSTARITFSKLPTNVSTSVVNLNVTYPYREGIRLSDGKNYLVGRLEIFVRGQWGTVCSTWLEMRDVLVS